MLIIKRMANDIGMNFMYFDKSLLNAIIKLNSVLKTAIPLHPSAILTNPFSFKLINTAGLNNNIDKLNFVKILQKIIEVYKVIKSGFGA
jgi:hypothetical protein